MGYVDCRAVQPLDNHLIGNVASNDLPDKILEGINK
jgi:hypothetical protein